MAVGEVTSRKAGRAGSAGWMVLKQMVARSRSRLAKLCTGTSSTVCLVAALPSAFGERAAAPATGLGRAAWAVALSSSVNRMAREKLSGEVEVDETFVGGRQGAGQPWPTRDDRRTVTRPAMANRVTMRALAW